MTSVYTNIAKKRVEQNKVITPPPLLSLSQAASSKLNPLNGSEENAKSASLLANQQTSKPANQQTSKEAKKQTSLPTKQQTSKEANLQTSKPTNQQASTQPLSTKEKKKYGTYLREDSISDIQVCAIQTKRKDHEVLQEIVDYFFAHTKK